MMKNQKGYSLLVLIIAVTVILIITSGVISTVNISMEEKEINNFIYDMNNIEETAKQYYANTGVIPGNVIVQIATDALKTQLDENDGEIYYLLDLSKLNITNLHEKDKTYIINGSSLRVYVLEGVRYKGEVYYTVTDALMGMKGKYQIQDQDISVSLTPTTWTRRVGIKVTIPNIAEALNGWTFKWNIGPKEIDFFQNGGGTEFEYGTGVTVNTNGVYSFYIKDANGKETLKNVVIKNIDDIYPTYKIDEEGNLTIRDDETGIKDVMYKTLAMYEKNVEEFRVGGKDAGKNELDFYVLHGTGDSLSQLKKDIQDFKAQKADIENRKKNIIEAYDRLNDEEKENGREKYENDINEINLEREELNTKYAHILDADGNLNINGEYVLYIEDYAENGTVIKNDKMTLNNICKNFNIPLN